MNDKADDAGRVGPQLSDELKRFAADLESLRPREDRLDRERLAFLAGQASMATGNIHSLSHSSSWRRHQAWPAAFATMSAIAAALLIALLMRPESSGLHQTAKNGRDNKAPELSIEQLNSFDVLTTRDAHFGDLQSRLVQRDVNRSDAATLLPISQAHDVSILTPNAWHQVINNTEKPTPSSDDSSTLYQNRGVTL